MKRKKRSQLKETQQFIFIVKFRLFYFIFFFLRIVSDLEIYLVLGISTPRFSFIDNVDTLQLKQPHLTTHKLVVILDPFYFFFLLNLSPFILYVYMLSLSTLSYQSSLFFYLQCEENLT